eukprot:TRINITY_DN31976_c0_g1_i1.p1 TRINITY_DN31976_c0_g1~~TRINITY_DN31976_c0_g1_i1.p1  ORF type:complete len:1058 (+),score=217.37 TRINITY_DN31976_c0_g1_i1:23-3196(+)
MHGTCVRDDGDIKVVEFQVPASFSKISEKWSYFKARSLSPKQEREETCCSCFSLLWKEFSNRLVASPQDYEKDNESFERTVAFLRSVPLLKTQLPPAELPKMARDLQRKVWRHGDTVVKQGEVGQAFFLIQSGQATVTVTDAAGKAHVRATLIPGDYFGGHTLVSQRQNVGTVRAQGALVTLSMSRQIFEHSGLKAQLTFPKRPALYFDRVSSQQEPSETELSSKFTEKTPEDEAFLLEALRRNVNLRAFADVSDQILKGLVDVAVKTSVVQGQTVALSGTLGQEFYVIKAGKIHALADGESERPRCAEATVAQLTMSDRLKRKQTFLKNLYSRRNSLGGSQSVVIPKPRGPRALSDWADSTPASPSPLSSKKPWGKTPQAQSDRSPAFSSTSGSPRDGMDYDTIRQNATKDFDSSRFQVGDEVSLPQENRRGTVSQVGVHPTGEAYVKVLFDMETKAGMRPTRSNSMPVDEQTRDCEEIEVNPDMLVMVEEGLIATLGPGDSFGELSLIYNALREATFTAAEDSEVYVISRKQFKGSFNRKGPRFKEYCTLLDEVSALSPLVQTERWELARNALGLFSFKPGERVLSQGVERKACLWYVIFSGSCVMSRADTGPDGKVVVNKLGELQRAGYFGERSLLTAFSEGKVPVRAVPEVNVDAGPAGMTCLTFEGEAIRILLEGLYERGAFGQGDQAMLPHAKSSSTMDFYNAKFATKGRRTKGQAQIEMSQLRKVCVLGCGGFAQVILVQDKSTKVQYALKRLSKGFVQKQQGAVRQLCWERELLMLVDSPFVISLVRTYQDEQFVYFLLEAALGGSLYEVLTKVPEVFLEDEPRGCSTAFYVACIIAGIEHLHDRHIVYRDLKPENVMLDEQGYAKLCDMGLARFVISKTNTLAGTPEYMAPEVIDFPNAHDTNCDWWSLGVLTFELNSGQTPWEDEGIDDQQGKLMAIRRSQEHGQPRYPFSCPALIKTFISKLLQKLPNRLGAGGRGAAELREQHLFAKLEFNFEALKAQKLPTPVSRPFRSRSRSSHESEEEGGGLEHPDHLFVPVTRGIAWDAEF